MTHKDLRAQINEVRAQLTPENYAQYKADFDRLERDIAVEGMAAYDTKYHRGESNGNG